MPAMFQSPQIGAILLTFTIHDMITDVEEFSFNPLKSGQSFSLPEDRGRLQRDVGFNPLKSGQSFSQNNRRKTTKNHR